MTVDDEISRIETGKNDIRKFSESRGVSIPASETIDHYTQYLNQIQASGVFFAEYNVTSFRDVLAAFKAGKNIWVTNLGNIFIPLFKVDNTENPQLFIFQQSYNAHNVEVQLGLSDQGTYWEFDQPRTSADSISAVVPTSFGARQNVQAYLDYLKNRLGKNASVGDLLRVKTVDVQGVPTALEPVSMAGLEGEWEVLEEVTTETASVFNRKATPSGRKYDLKALRMQVTFPSTQHENVGFVFIDEKGYWINTISLTVNYSYLFMQSEVRHGVSENRNAVEVGENQITTWRGGSVDVLDTPVKAYCEITTGQVVPAGSKIKIEGVWRE